jgi:hypothetical protein
MNNQLVKPQTKNATYEREHGHSGKIQMAIIKHEEKTGIHITMSDYINNAVNVQLKKDGIIK